MNMRWLGAALLIGALATTGIVLAANQEIEMQPGDSLTVECSTRLTGIIRGDRATIRCIGEAVATATGTVVATATQTATSIATSTGTPMPTATVTATVAATATGTPTSGVPACTDHDVTKYHGLVKRNGNQIICAYGHTHFDDPHALDAAFGPLPYGEISYPWMTPNENVYGSGSLPSKHVFYKWQTYDGACVAQGTQYGLRRFRLEAHADANAGALTRFHSFFLQAEVCQPSNPAISYKVTTGGHYDTGHLSLNDQTYVPLPGDDGGNTGRRRIHGSPSIPQQDWTWYGGTEIASLGLRQEDWGPVDPNNLSRQLFYADPEQNHSWQEIGHIIGVRHSFDFEFAMSGFSTRDGRPAAAGCAVGPDCVPFNFGGMPAGATAQYEADAVGPPVIRDYDVHDASGKSFIVFPN